MQPVNISEAQLTQQAADRQTNYLILRTLESKIPQEQFRALLTQAAPTLTLPDRTNWDGRQLPSSYQELKQRFGSSDETLLTNLVLSMTSQKNTNFGVDSTKVQTLTNFLKLHNEATVLAKPNILASFRKSLSFCQENTHKATAIEEVSQIERVKTVFSHVDFSKDEVSPIYNVQFDQTGSFIISAADDGVIKLWDRDTLTLQASLHAHFDYITWIIISNCNKFIVSAGNDAQIIVWELATGKLVQRINHHTKLINVIKFFCPRSSQIALDALQHSRTPDQSQSHSQPIQQFLFSCSDDGTVRLYDFTPISGWNKPGEPQFQQKTTEPEEELHRVRRSSRQTSKPSLSSSTPTEGAQQVQDGIYTIELTPNDYRPGVKSNKKLETLVMNHNGLVIAGSGSGDVFVWRINYDSIQKQLPKQDCYIYLGSFKMPKQSGIKFSEFQPKGGVPGVGETLMTGSADGVVKLWHMNVGKWKNQQRQQSFDMNDKSRLFLQIDESNGCLISKQIKSIIGGTSDEEVDWVLEQVPSEGEKPQDYKFSKHQCDQIRWSINGRFAISSITSKVDDNSGDEICKIKIWDQVDQTFYDDLGKSSGIILKKFIYVLAAHPIQEEILMSGSEGGLLILWNLRTKQSLKRFEQYGVYSVDAGVMDNPLDGKWSPDGRAFVTGNNCGTITLYSCEDKKHQYESTRVHQFFQFDFALQHQRDNPFERLQNRPSICDYNMMPYEVQPQKSLIRFPELEASQDAKKFNRDLQLARELGTMEEKYYLDQLHSYLNGNQIPNGQLLSQDVEMIQEANLRPQQFLRADEISDSEQEEQRRFQAIRQDQQNRGQAANRGRPRLQRNNERGVSSRQAAPQQQHQQQAHRALQAQQNQDDDDDSQMSDSNSQQSESLVSESEELSEVQQIQTSRRRRHQEQVARSGRPQRAARPQNLRDFETVQDEESIDLRQRNHRRANRRNIEASSLQSFCSDLEELESPEVQRNQRGRNQRPAIVTEFSLDSNRVTTKRSSKDDGKYTIENGQMGYFYMSDNNLPEQQSNKINQTSLMMTQVSKNQKEKLESNFEVQKQTTRPANVSCALCKRVDGELIGLIANGQNKNQIYLHQDCVETNCYSYFNIKTSKWVKIETMLKHLKEDAQYSCFRCDKDGASISCHQCGKNFHGYYCAGFYNILVPVDEGEIEGPTTAFCLFCKNENNFEDQENFTKEDKEMKAYFNQLRQIDKQHLLRVTNSLKDQKSQQVIQETYSPQIDDVLVYFWQGHENFIYQYNCHFYAGQQKVLPYQRLMPWFNTINSNVVRNSEITIVRVISVTTLFPSRRSLNLIQQFGADSTACRQEAQIIQRIELQIINSSSLTEGDKFTVDIFPNELPDFLILFQVFHAQKIMYQSQSLIGKTVNVKSKQGVKKVKIIEESSLEATFFPKSLWQTIVCQPATSLSTLSRPSRSQVSDEVFRINFWDIIYEKSDSKPDNLQNQLSPLLSQDQQKRLHDGLQKLMRDMKEYLIYFSDRVNEKIAPEYRQIISQEMWFGLILQRLQQGQYYRSCNQIMADIDLIASNAACYNGAKDDIAVDASEVVNKIKTDLWKLQDMWGEKFVKQRIEEAKTVFSSVFLKQNLVKELNKSLSQAQEIQIDTTVTIKPENYNKDKEESKEEPPMARLGRRRRQVDDFIQVDEMEQQNSSLNHSESRTLRKRPRVQ